MVNKLAKSINLEESQLLTGSLDEVISRLLEIKESWTKKGIEPHVLLESLGTYEEQSLYLKIYEPNTSLEESLQKDMNHLMLKES